MKSPLLYPALDYLKREIERNQAELKHADGYGRMTLERLIEWQLERGLNLIQYAKPEEVDQDMIDWFLGRIDGERPDIKKIEKRLNEEDRIEEESQKSWNGKLKFWLWKLRKRICHWWLK